MVREGQGEGGYEVQGEELCVCFYECLRECVLFSIWDPVQLLLVSGQG